MKKKIIITITIIIALILLIPIPFILRDGGSIEFRGLLYTITKYHRLAPIDGNTDDGYIDGIGIEILGMEIYNNTDNDKVVVCYDEKQDMTDEENNTSKIQNSFVGTVLEETTTYMIVEPNEDEEERKSADKIVINYGTDHIDYLYGIGRKVLIYYTGYIKETYPAQIDTDEIAIDGYSNFEITVQESEKVESKKILNNTELYKNNSDYNLYYYGLEEVNVKVDNEIITLKQALETGKITLEGMISKANRDFSDAISYDDGGSMEYHYDTYTIIKCHSLDGNRDVWIGIPEMTLNHINRE